MSKAPSARTSISFEIATVTRPVACSRMSISRTRTPSGTAASSVARDCMPVFVNASSSATSAAICWTSSRTSAICGCRAGSARASRISVATWRRPIGEPSSWATSPRKRFWPLTRVSRRSAMRLTEEPRTPSSSRRLRTTRVANCPSAIRSVAPESRCSARVMLPTKGSQNRTESKNALAAMASHGPAWRSRPTAKTEEARMMTVPAVGWPNSLGMGTRRPIHVASGDAECTINRPSLPRASGGGRPPRGGPSFLRRESGGGPRSS